MEDEGSVYEQGYFTFIRGDRWALLIQFEVHYCKGSEWGKFSWEQS